MNENYYLVEAMCGHVGAYAYIPVVFPFYAEDGKDAAKKARSIPRVKHHNKYAILHVKKVSYEDYVAQQRANEEDAYLNWSKTGYSEEYVSTVSERIKFFDDNPYVARRKKERQRRSDREYRGCTNTRLNLCEN